MHKEGSVDAWCEVVSFLALGIFAAEAMFLFHSKCHFPVGIGENANHTSLSTQSALLEDKLVNNGVTQVAF